MTESDWLSSTDPQAMLSFLQDRGPVSERKLRLFTVACCYLIWPLMTDERDRRVVEVAERFADGLADEAERESTSVHNDSDPARRTNFTSAGCAAGWARALPLTVEEAGLGARHATDALSKLAVAAGQRDQCDALRCVFGNPFRPVPFSPEWRTEAVVALARGIYEERAWDRMPVLGDALEDAGCADEPVLAHCRGPNVHVRGCWVTDLVLGKE